MTTQTDTPDHGMSVIATHMSKLQSERDSALARVAELEKLANTALDELHQLNVAFNFARLSMDEQSREIAGEMADDVRAFITKSRAALSPKEGV